MTRLRGSYDAMHATSPASDPPNELVDAMQAGDRLGYHPETAQEEIARFHQALRKAQAAIAAIGVDFAEQLEDRLKRYSPQRWLPTGIDMETQKKSRLDAFAKARRLVDEAGK